MVRAGLTEVPSQQLAETGLVTVTLKVNGADVPALVSAHQAPPRAVKHARWLALTSSLVPSRRNHHVMHAPTRS